MRLPAEALLGGEGQAFAIAQTRLGGGRIHHAMRTIGMAKRALDAMCERALSRQVAGGLLAEKQFVQGFIADSYAQLMQFRLYVLYTAWLIDKHNNYLKVRKDIAAIKVLMPGVLHDIAWRAIQIHGALGISNEMPFHSMLVGASVMGLADGPTEVHKVTVARQVLRDHSAADDLWPTSAPPEASRRGTGEVRRHPRARSGEFLMIDIDRLATWMDERGLGVGEPVESAFVSGGTQNEIYEIRRGDVHAALRIPPPSAPETRDAGILREWRIIDALDGTDVPHTAAIAVCEDPSVLGRTFYLMGYVDGWSPMNTDGWPAPFDTDLDARKGLAFELIDGISLLSMVDWKAKGLSDFGHPEGFHERQVDRWTAFLERIKGRELPGFDEASAWLRTHRPIDFVPGLMHGDYQFANVMYRHGGAGPDGGHRGLGDGHRRRPETGPGLGGQRLAGGSRRHAGHQLRRHDGDAVPIGRPRPVHRGVRASGRRHRLLLRAGQVEARRRARAGLPAGRRQPNCSRCTVRWCST